MASRSSCKRCGAPIVWGKDAGRYIPLNPDGALHSTTCAAATSRTCRYCALPVIWKEHEGKLQCFEPDAVTLHNDTCKHRDECAHCGQKVRWTPIDGKWLAFDAVLTKDLHWNLCPKNPDAAKEFVRRVATLQNEVDRLNAYVKKLEGDVRVREVELVRLTRKTEKIGRAS